MLKTYILRLKAHVLRLKTHVFTINMHSVILILIFYYKLSQNDLIMTQLLLLIFLMHSKFSKTGRVMYFVKHETTKLSAFPRVGITQLFAKQDHVES